MLHSAMKQGKWLSCHVSHFTEHQIIRNKNKINSICKFLKGDSELKIDRAIQERKTDNTFKFSFSVFKMNAATFCNSYSSIFFSDFDIFDI